MKLPDFEAWAMFAKVAEAGSFVAAARDLRVSQATVSKAVGRLESRLGATLFHRTSRRLSLSDSGLRALDDARQLLEAGEALEADASVHSARPRGVVRVTAPMSFGLAHLGAMLPDFFALYPEITIELTLADHFIDIVEEGYDVALRIADLGDSSLMVRRLAPVRVLLVGAPDYFARRGYPQHPKDLLDHTGLIYSNGKSKGVWRFHHPVEGQYSVSVTSPLRVNNADIFRPALLSGAGVAMQPDFLVWEDVAAGRLEVAMPDWRAPELSLFLVTPPSRIRPARVEILLKFLSERIASFPWVPESARERLR